MGSRIASCKPANSKHPILYLAGIRVDWSNIPTSQVEISRDLVAMRTRWRHSYGPVEVA